MPEFSRWERWGRRFELPGLSLPGVYAVAISEIDISGNEFSWLDSVAYVGMTNSKAGLKGRLQQFDQTIRGRSGHGGAERFRFKHAAHDELEPLLHVAVCPFGCDVRSNSPSDLRVMGEVARYEYECLAQFVEAHGCLPEFNDKERSPKHGLRQGLASTIEDSEGA